MELNAPKTGSGTVDKALDVLFFLSECADAQSLSAIARALKMPKSSVHRLLVTLLRRQLVEQDERACYQIGIALVALGLGVLEREPIAFAARPVLEAAAAEVGETFFLVVARAGQLVVLEKAEGNGFLRAAPRVGSSVPVHATAVGKLYRAFAPNMLSDISFEAFTEHTLCAQEPFDKAALQARDQGWASNLEEWQSGLAVLAAPVLVAGRLVACVALAMVAPRLHELGIEVLARRVSHAAEGIALRIEVKQ